MAIVLQVKTANPAEPPRIFVRRATRADTPQIWALNDIPHIGATADPDAPLSLPTPTQPPVRFPDLSDVGESFVGRGGDFLLVESEGHVVGMGGVRPNGRAQGEVLHVRVHPARRRLGIGRFLMNALESRAAELGCIEMFLATATNQPEAVAFYEDLGYTAVGRETRSEWQWTLVYFAKSLRVTER